MPQPTFEVTEPRIDAVSEYVTVTAGERPAVSGAGRSGTAADASLRWLTSAAAVGVLGLLASLLVVLFLAALPAVREFGWGFVTGTEWRPNALELPKKGADGKVIIEDGEMVMETKPPVFGALPVIYGTVVSSVIALVIAVPISFGAAIFLVRIAPRGLAQPVSFMIEFLAAIPSIAYGIWGLFVVAPFLQTHLEPFLRSTVGALPFMKWLFYETIVIAGKPVVREIPLVGRDMFCGGVVLAIMILPIITAISRDVLRSVPRIQIEGTMALGATWWQSSKAMLRYSRSALFGAVMLGLARAAGETMAITMVIGNNNQIKASLFAPAQTMSSLLANEFREASGIHLSALATVALILLVMSLGFNMIARWLVVGKGSRGAAGH
ncbi:MAG TPA: phosphate ABC transporter permease subunit PstC [Tepidisphaeraceae bacterium]|nr:phosphate ABC transporter permease subunit PstC [Tepidisphaeraceae bacterium]